MKTHVTLNLPKLAIAAFLYAIFVPQALADIVISIDQKTANAAGVVLIGVYASSDSGDFISGFNLPFDYNNDGLVDTNNDGVGELPSGFSFPNVVLANPIYANTVPARPLPQIALIGVDFIATGNGDNIQLGNSANPTKLFDLGIQVGPNVAVGTVLPFQIKVPNQPFSTLFFVAGPNNPRVTIPVPGTPANGSLTIVAVPEPSTLALLLPLLALLFSRVVWKHVASRSLLPRATHGL